MTIFKATAGLVSLSILAACTGSNGPAAPVVFRGSDPTNGQPAAANPAGDPRGIITYATYQAVQVQPGDTMQSIADRVGAPLDELLSYNGLDRSYIPTPGETIVLPPRADRYGVGAANTAAPGGTGWSPERVGAAIERATVPAATVPAPVVGGAPAGPDPSVPRDGVTPVRHVVGPSETLFSIARLYDVSVTALAGWNRIGGDFAVSPGETIYVPLQDEASRATPAPTVVGAPTVGAGPAVASAPAVAGGAVTAVPVPAPGVPAPTVPAAAPAEDPAITAAVAATAVNTGVVRPAPRPGARASGIGRPASASDPLPPDTAVAAVPASPQLSSTTTPPASNAVFLKPVDGPVLRPYSPAPGPNQNEGIDFAAASGEAVRAADEGEVVLVSRSVGELDTIVMIRHPNDLVTVYGRIGEVDVARGDRISRGQPIGKVAARDTPSVQFQIRRGMDHVDPAPYL
ncbi:MAG: LysM peptidoglycan-binding domain-containing protein [Pseudomonadota bacterium]